MRFQVPQFITVEDKLFGPLTLKQFIYVAGGGGLSFVIYRFLSPYLPFLVIIPIIAPVVAFSLALAFYKPNEKPFIHILESAFKYFVASKLYIWKKTERKTKLAEKDNKEREALTLYIPKLSDSKLKDLTWSLDIKENVSPGARETMRK